MSTVSENVVGIKIQASGATAAAAQFAKLEKATHSLHHGLENLEHAAGALAGGFLTIFSGEKLLEFAHAAEAGAASVRLLQAALAATGQSDSFGLLSEQAKELGHEINKGGSTIREVQRLLLELNLTAEKTAEITPHIFDMAAALGKDPGAIATALAKAYAGNFAGLARLGIVVDNVEALERAYGRSAGAAAAAVTPTERLHHAWEALEMTLGRLVKASGFDAFFNKLSAGLGHLTEDVDKLVKSHPQMMAMLESLGGALGQAVADNLGKIAIAAAAISTAITAGGLLKGLGMVGNLLKALPGGSAVLGLVNPTTALAAAVAGLFAATTSGEGHGTLDNLKLALDYAVIKGKEFVGIMTAPEAWASLKELSDKYNASRADKPHAAEHGHAAEKVTAAAEVMPEIPALMHDNAVMLEQSMERFRQNSERALVGVTSLTEQYRLQMEALDAEAIALRGMDVSYDRQLANAKARHAAQLQVAELAYKGTEALKDRTAAEKTYNEAKEKAEEEYAKAVEKHGAAELNVNGQLLTIDQKRAALHDKLVGSTYAGQAGNTYQRFLDSEQAENALGNGGTLAGGVAGMQEAIAAIGTAAEQAGRAMKTFIGGAVDGISEGLKGLLKGTMTWAQALATIGGSIMDGIIDAISRMFAEWIVGLLMRSAVTKATAASDAAAKAPVALLSSIESFGIAAAIGGAAFLAMMALTGGFAEGGYTGNAAVNMPAGVVHGQEYVFTAPVTASLGRDDLDALHRGQAEITRPGQSGGGAGVNVAVFNTKAESAAWLRSGEGRGIMLDVFRQHRHEFI